jgi:hypothetical protein
MTAYSWALEYRRPRDHPATVMRIGFDEARMVFEKMFDLAAKGEVVIVSKNEQKVVLTAYDQEVAPAGYFADDYDEEDVRLMNALADH